MERPLYLPTLILILISSPILASSHLQIPLEIEETNEQLENDISFFFKAITKINNFIGCYSFIVLTGNLQLKPSLEHRLMQHFGMPMYTVDSNNGPVNHRYNRAQNIVITVFNGLDDPILNVLNDTELSNGNHHYNFLYVSRSKQKSHLTIDEIWKFFSWCFELKIDRVLLFFRGEFEFEIWTYFYVTNLTLTKITNETNFQDVFRNHGFRFSVQVANDLPSIFWVSFWVESSIIIKFKRIIIHMPFPQYNSTEQADVIGGRNISLSGPIGMLMVEFMHYMNATMDILPIKERLNSNYEIVQAPNDQKADLVANLVINDSLLFSPVVMDTKICLLVPHRRKIPSSRYFEKVIDSSVHLIMLPVVLLVFAIKYIAHRRRSLVDSLFSTFRFYLGIPLPGGQLDRLPLADKIIEGFLLLFMLVLINAFGSLLSSAFTAGLYYPPITDVESMRSSGLRIITDDPTIQQAFRENHLPSSLADLVDLVDSYTEFKSFKDLNQSVVKVSRTPNWWGIQLYQERLKSKRLAIAGPELCSNACFLRVPISPKSPLRFTIYDYFYKIFESGLHQKWQRMSYQKFRKVYGLTKLPTDMDIEWRPLSISFYAIFLQIYMGGMLLSIIVFVIELLYKRYRG
ncbi:hypothetical protein KR032_007124 [Drosophila birchii]|nr:hypothetical protein KR032_007124 [Drosophila birchii]